MKLLLERWRKLLEGEVIDFPIQPEISKADLTFVDMVERSLVTRLNAIYGGSQYWPIEVIDRSDKLVIELEELLKKQSVRSEDE